MSISSFKTSALFCFSRTLSRVSRRGWLALALLALFGGLKTGCTKSAPAHAGPAPAPTAQIAPVERNQVRRDGQGTVAGSSPTRPATDFDVDSPDRTLPDPESTGSSPAPGIIGGLRNVIQSFDLGFEEDLQGGLLQQLDDASVQLQKIRRDNRNAIRDVNRQVRLGRNGSSPNIILIQLERLSPDDLTEEELDDRPHVAALISNGRRFTRHYAASSTLSLARWGLLTGKNPVVIPPASGPVRLPTTQQTLPNLLWNGGYATTFIGQWDHPELPLSLGYDEWVGFLRREEATAYPAKVRINLSEMELLANQSGSDAEKRVHAIDLFTSEVVQFLIRNQNSNRPFFLHISLPHVDDNEGSSILQSRLTPRVDAMFGKIASVLERFQLTSNTCVILTAESGPALRLNSDPPQTLSNGTRIFAHGLGEGNLHIPLIVSWPGRVSPGTTEQLTATWDLLPTLLELTSTRGTAAGISGVSFASLLLHEAKKSGPQELHPLLYWATPDRSVQTVRKENWKGLLVRGETAVRLYDLSSDPGETNDIASSSPDVVKQLMAQ